MAESALFWFFLNFVMILLLAFFSMIEMALVSFNKVRLQYYMSKENRKAALIYDLLKNPSHLFGTTLIGVNVTMFISSEAARQLHSAIGINPDLAPLSEVTIVVILGELAPLFAARRYAEHVSMLGIPFLYACSKAMTPLIIAIDYLSKAVQKLVGVKEGKHSIYLNKDELEKLIEEVPTSRGQDEFQHMVSNLLDFREKKVTDLMTPLSRVSMVPSHCTVEHMRRVLTESKTSYLPVYNKSVANIVGIAFARDLVRAADNRRVRSFSRAPWFISKKTPLIELLKQFRINNQRLAVVLNEQGRSVGIITLRDLINHILENPIENEDSSIEVNQESPLIERTFPGDTSIESFNEEFSQSLDAHGCETLADLFLQHAGHHPEEGDKIYIAPYELEVKESSLLEIKSITVRTKI